nr:MAK10-like protein [Tanacetum cinerariifolium]
ASSDEDGKEVERVKYVGLLEETINKFMEESSKKQATFDEWIRKFRDDTDSNLRMLDVATKNMEVRAKQLTQAILTNNIVDKAKDMKVWKEQEEEAQAFRTLEGLKSKKPFVEEDTVRLNDRCLATFQNQPPSEENDQGSFTLPCLIGERTWIGARMLIKLQGSISSRASWMPYRRAIDQSAGGKLHEKNAEDSWAIIEDLALYANESWNDPRDFAKPVKEMSLPRDVLNTSDRRLIKLENQV